MRTRLILLAAIAAVFGSLSLGGASPTPHEPVTDLARWIAPADEAVTTTFTTERPTAPATTDVRSAMPQRTGERRQPDARDRPHRPQEAGTEREDPAADAQREEHLSGPTSPEGFQVAGGTATAGAGPAVTYTVELEPEVDVELSELVTVVEAALHDPRSWANDRTLERIDDPSVADVRVLLATPATVDALCRRAGLVTNGIFSCWNGRFAALNSMRWEEGAVGFGDDIDGYRTYLVNHEFGHGLGYGHVGCPAAGTPAPIMMQQTRGTEGCEPNGWPYPDIDPGPTNEDRAPEPIEGTHGAHEPTFN